MQKEFSLISANKPRGWYSGKNLPHCDQPSLVQHVTPHLADSIPNEARSRLEAAIAHLADDERDRQRRQRYQELLNAGYGKCVLRLSEIAELVAASLHHFEGTRYQIFGLGSDAQSCSCAHWHECGN